MFKVLFFWNKSFGVPANHFFLFLEMTNFNLNVILIQLKKKKKQLN